MNKTVTQKWVCALPFKMQSLLFVALRGPDGISKRCSAKYILRFMRGTVLRPYDPKYKGNSDSFMWTDYEEADAWNVAINDFFDDHDSYPHHFIMHLIHAAEVIGYMHPDKKDIGSKWRLFYVRACDALHMNPETPKQFLERLSDEN